MLITSVYCVRNALCEYRSDVEGSNPVYVHALNI